MYERVRVYRAKKMLDALNSESKLRILRRLLESPASATDLANEFGLTLPAVTLHLRDLEEAGLIKILEVRKGKGRPAKLYTLKSRRITLNIYLDELLELPEEEELDSLVREYVRRKLEGGLRRLSISDVMETLSVSKTVAAAIVERIQSDPSPLLEAIGERIMESIGVVGTTAELVKRLGMDRYWISRALESLRTRGLIEVKGGKIFRLEGGSVGGHSSGGN
ncbi:MAG: ArsR family transcriptional regulator [Candidatus Korarchaeum sp.]|nr:ArsR family transcriptional regulator [Candidatus Korarchaeum sp.]MDW8035028.1 ArsR family transcriptional regulator [Candidatus Korarchaeum sp.]